MAMSFSRASAEFTSEGFWSGTRRPVEQAVGLQPAAYADDGFFALERQRLFGRAWVAVAAAAEVAEPGRLLVRTVGDTSVLITRGRDGVLRGFVNACRHRGTELAAADCSLGRTIRCPYHRWGYALDGSLVSTPLFDEVPRPDFDPGEFSLLPVRVDTGRSRVSHVHTADYAVSIPQIVPDGTRGPSPPLTTRCPEVAGAKLVRELVVQRWFRRQFGWGCVPSKCRESGAAGSG